jgi:ribonuclease I
MSLLRPRLVLLFLALLVGASCEAQALERNTPGEFDYYVLVLGWAPSYCLTEGGLRRDAESKPHAFVLHGLWPQYEKGWPEDCSIGKRPWVPTSVIDEMRDIMPSKGLIIHEYRTHGTCSGLDPVQYFGVARELYERVRIPESLAASRARQSLSGRSDRKRVCRRQSLAEAGDDVGELSRRESSRCQDLLRPRSLPTGVRRE